MEIGEIVEIGERQIEVTPRRETPSAPAPQRTPVPAPERQKEDA